jgi:small-conductance mechanosensitive channel
MLSVRVALALGGPVRPATATDSELARTTDEVSASAGSMWETFLEALPRIGVALVLVAIGWVVSRVVRHVLATVWNRTHSPSFADVMSKLVGWTISTIAVLLSIAVTFPSVRPVDILAGLGFFSLAIGFAFQDILENTLSGVLLLFRQPFRAGDEIEVIGWLGTVQAITIRETRIRTFDGQLVIIPNRDVYKSAIRVQTAFPTRRIEVTVGIAFESDIDHAASAITEAASSEPHVEAEPPPLVTATTLASKVVDLRLWFWTDPSQMNAAVTTHRVVEAVKRRLDADGIEMPADLIALQATSSLAAALRGEPVTPGGAVAR